MHAYTSMHEDECTPALLLRLYAVLMFKGMLCAHPDSRCSVHGLHIKNERMKFLPSQILPSFSGLRRLHRATEATVTASLLAPPHGTPSRVTEVLEGQTRLQKCLCVEGRRLCSLWQAVDLDAVVMGGSREGAQRVRLTAGRMS